MKKSILLLSLLVSSFVFSQNIFWYDVLLEVDSKNASTVAGLVDGFYSNHTKASNVNVSFSSIPLKGASEKATHIISIASDSSESLADFRNSLKGSDWDLYISKMSNYVESSRAISTIPVRLFCRVSSPSAISTLFKITWFRSKITLNTPTA